jgi:hypothetical protein
LVLMVYLLSACSLFTQTTKPLTTKQQATIWMVVYNSVYDDTMAQAKNPTATPAQKEMVAKKKAILAQTWPLLKIYVGIVDTGGTPSVESSQQISDLINQLAALAGGK